MIHPERRRPGALLALSVVLVGLLGLPHVAAAQGDDRADRVDVLIVDETKTFQASLVVNALAGGLKQTGLFNVNAVFPDVASSYDDPLGRNSGDATYEIILIVPRADVLFGLGQLWIATCNIPHRASPDVIEGVETIQTLVANNDQVDIRALSVADDAMPGYFAALLMDHGWLRCGSES
ncbi:MAG: hypothetical protein ABEK03_06080 [Candidatus Bipolaricaulia bacterium]